MLLGRRILTSFGLCAQSYSRISIEDICEKLKLEDKQDAEYIVAKAIRDGVIDATLDHAKQVRIDDPHTRMLSCAAPEATMVVWLLWKS